MKHTFRASNIIIISILLLSMIVAPIVSAVENNKIALNGTISDKTVFSTIESAYANPILTDNKNELQKLINKCTDNMNTAHEMAECARRLGYEESCYIIKEAQRTWNNYNNIKKYYQNHLNEVIAKEKAAATKKSEYPNASYAWNYLKSLGYNNYVCAGILGNMMVECGGHTLNLEPLIYSPGGTYYGICQWNKYNYGSIHGATFDDQLIYLKNTIKGEIDEFGYVYSSGFNYNKFINLTNCREAALAFAMCYERCGSDTYYLRQNCAETAYNYFVN